MSTTIFNRQRHSVDCGCSLCAISAQAHALVATEPHTLATISGRDFQVIVACLRLIEQQHQSVVGVTREEVREARSNLQRAKLKAIEAEIERTSDFLDVPTFLRRQAD